MRNPRLLALPALLLLIAAPLGAQQSWIGDARRDYRAFGRVDDMLRWAPFDCRFQLPSPARVSAAGDHARKVYFVYASDRSAYLEASRGGAAPPVGLTVVKEAFAPARLERLDRHAQLHGLPIPSAPESSEPLPSARLPMASPNRYRPIPDEQGGAIGAGAPRGLYLMRYLGPDAPRTDAGWVYATIDAEGRVDRSPATCAGCHRQAGADRLFGTPLTPL